MLLVCQNILLVEVPHNIAVNNMFQNLASHGGERNRSVVRREVFWALLVQRYDESLLPVSRYAYIIEWALVYLCQRWKQF